MRIAEHLAYENGCHGLVTGESVGQVASQTFASLVSTNEVCTLPVLRPLIAFDKQEIVEISEKIGTYETSILPYEDCCTVFTPKHPRTRPTIEDIKAGQAQFDFEPMIKEAVEKTVFKIIRCGENNVDL